MAWTAAEEARIQALEADIAQLVEKVDLNMVTKTEFHAKTLLLERDIQELQTSVEDLQSQLTTLRDAYLAHDSHPPTV